MISAAAIKLHSGLVLTLHRPHRHSDIRLGAESLGISLYGAVDGFIDVDGHFHNRKMAMKLARAAKEVPESLRGDELYTEMLW